MDIPGLLRAAVLDKSGFRASAGCEPDSVQINSSIIGNPEVGFPPDRASLYPGRLPVCADGRLCFSGRMLATT